jgi:hypothetical protein
VRPRAIDLRTARLSTGQEQTSRDNSDRSDRSNMEDPLLYCVCHRLLVLPAAFPSPRVLRPLTKIAQTQLQRARLLFLFPRGYPRETASAFLHVDSPSRSRSVTTPPATSWHLTARSSAHSLHLRRRRGVACAGSPRCAPMDIEQWGCSGEGASVDGATLFRTYQQPRNEEGCSDGGGALGRGSGG